MSPARGPGRRGGRASRGHRTRGGALLEEMGGGGAREEGRADEGGWGGAGAASRLGILRAYWPWTASCSTAWGGISGLWCGQRRPGWRRRIRRRNPTTQGSPEVGRGFVHLDPGGADSIRLTSRLTAFVVRVL